jgi:hypothetical protein
MGVQQACLPDPSYQRPRSRWPDQDVPDLFHELWSMPPSKRRPAAGSPSTGC